ncbi:hypothetical protein [Ornithinibacillus bavariensis]|uniref:hypothetical protein n=1 Tax=Ornithinibacillus bavariensis TaxID=545502 RepID=UPI000EBE1928|nr:hypothetical protein [Ornithinibacillus sp.]
MTIKSDVHDWNNKAQADGPCRGLVQGYYLPASDVFPESFGIIGMANYEITKNGKQFTIGTPKHPYGESVLTVYIVKVAELKPEPRPESKKENKPKTTQPKEETNSNTTAKVESSNTAVKEKSESTNHSPNKQQKETTSKDYENQKEEVDTVYEGVEDDIQENNEESIGLSEFQKRSTYEKLNPFEESSVDIANEIEIHKEDEKLDSNELTNEPGRKSIIIISSSIAIVLIIGVIILRFKKKGKIT